MLVHEYNVTSTNTFTNTYFRIMNKSDRDIVVDLGKYVDQRVRVRFQGGREGRS